MSVRVCERKRVSARERGVTSSRTRYAVDCRERVRVCERVSKRERKSERERERERERRHTLHPPVRVCESECVRERGG